MTDGEDDRGQSHAVPGCHLSIYMDFSQGTYNFYKLATIIQTVKQDPVRHSPLFTLYNYSIVNIQSIHGCIHLYISYRALSGSNWVTSKNISRPMSAGYGGCWPVTVKVLSPADTGRPAVILMLVRDS